MLYRHLRISDCRVSFSLVGLLSTFTFFLLVCNPNLLCQDEKISQGPLKDVFRYFARPKDVFVPLSTLYLSYGSNGTDM